MLQRVVPNQDPLHPCSRGHVTMFHGKEGGCWYLAGRETKDGPSLVYFHCQRTCSWWVFNKNQGPSLLSSFPFWRQAALTFEFPGQALLRFPWMGHKKIISENGSKAKVKTDLKEYLSCQATKGHSTNSQTTVQKMFYNYPGSFSLLVICLLICKERRQQKIQ
jgi:hypothetical protein